MFEYKNVIKIIYFLLLCGASVNLGAQDVEKEMEKLKGVFTGEWTSFKKGVSGEIVAANSWKDTLITEEPIKDESTVHVKVKCSYTFDNPQIPPYYLEFREGFYYEGDQVKDHFFSTGGSITKFTELDENTFVYNQEIHQNEFHQMRFLRGLDGVHSIVKVVTNEEGQEFHRITRISTLRYLDEDDKIKSTQFVSLVGYHKRIE